MRWLTFILFGLVVITFQMSIAPMIQWGGASPDWVLAFLLFFALNAKTNDILIGAWILGAILDLMTANQFGLMSFSYGIGTLIVYAVRESVFREKMGTHAATTFLVCMLIQMGIACYRSLQFGDATGSFGSLTAEAFRTALYSTAFAPLIFYFLHKGYWMLGLKSVGRGRI